MAKYETITLKKSEADYLNEIASITGDKAYEKYGLHRDETVTHTADFGDGYTIDVKAVVGDGEEYGYAEAVLFYNGAEVACSDVEEEVTGEWEFEVNGTSYIARVTAE